MLITPGPNAGPQYPYIAVDERGIVYAAWTSPKHGEYLYWSIHAVRSLDAGVTWQRLDVAPLALPIVCDDTGPATPFVLADELSAHTWLWNIAPTHGKLHAGYLAQLMPGRQHYVRHDAFTGAEDLRIQPQFAGSALGLVSLDGVPVVDRGAPLRVFFASATTGPRRLGVLQSTDNGATWLDLGVSAEVPTIYSSGGARDVTEAGELIGAFTDSTDVNAVKVYFFKLPTRTADDPVACL